jgi:beta-lactamase superfamily II metal-dependent hydrolase
MKKSTRWLLGGLALGAGAVSAVNAYLKRNNVQTEKKAGDVWARPGMSVTFRAEVMPGRDRNERTFLVKELLASGRVLLHGADGEHAEKEFEPIQFDRPAY